MAQLQGGFNPQQFDPTQGTPQLPVGKHPVVISGSEIKANNKNDGGYLQLDLTIIDGPSKGSTGAYRLNLYHTNQMTVEIAHRQLSAVCHAVGYLQPFQDSSVLHNLPFIVEVGLQNTEEGKAKGYTQVVKVYDKNNNEPGKSVTPAQAQPVQGPQGGGWGGAPQNQQQAPQPGQPGGWGNQGAQPQNHVGAAPGAGGGGWQQAGGPGPAAGVPAGAPAGGGWNQIAGNGGGAPGWAK